MRIAAILLGIVLSLCGSSSTAQAENLLRNGSFEGSLLYWHHVDPAVHTLVEDAAVGTYALRIESSYVMSAPFVCERGQPFTVSFFVKGEKPGRVSVQLPPSAREVAQQAKRIWNGDGTQTAEIGTEWKRVSFVGQANVPPSGFWPLPHYMVMIGGSVPMLIDGVTVEVGDKRSENYLPRRPIEVVTACPDLPGYRNNGNLFEPGSSVRMSAFVSNPSDQTVKATLRWQLYDYEGTEPVGPAIDRPIELAPGATVEDTRPLELTADGTVLARATVLVDNAEVDRSDFPLTSLPYEKGPRKPDTRERFGGSFFGPASAERGSRIGFGWSRWYPHTKWQDHQPESRDKFHWFDDELDKLEAMGISTHIVLYGWPKWIMDEKHPLPKDMRWSADDARWSDLSIETAWDHYIKKTVDHYRGRPVIYEIENEPELDRWDGLRDEYVQFTIRTARLIKQVDPKAKVMVNNLHGIPSGLNHHLLENGAAKYLDIISWHDYHAGWLSDAAAMRRMRATLDSLGGEHLEIWFNEGWAFTNTAVDQPIACTTLTSAESTNATICSIAELTLHGQDKTILFHTSYDKHGMSFWDYSGPGTMLWDWYDYPMPLVPAWNTLAHHVGLSEPVGLVRPKGANFCIFEDLRNGRGVMVAYVDRSANEDATIELPLDNLFVEDAMGNSRQLSGRTLTLSKTGRPVFLYASDKTSGRTFYEKLEPLDRKYESFVDGSGRYSLPGAWVGERNGSAEGNPVVTQGRPIWALEQVWPADPTKPENYRPLVWRDGWWVAAANSFGDQPKAEQRDTAIRLEFRASHGSSPGEKICGLTFHAPADGHYKIRARAKGRLWEGNNPVRLTALKRSKDSVEQLASWAMTPGEVIEVNDLTVELRAGEAVVLLPRIEGMHNGGDMVISDVQFVSSEASARTWRLPAAWEGETVGEAAGNPISSGGVPVWRLDQVYPHDPVMTTHYRPLVWKGSVWAGAEHTHAGHPSASVNDGSIRFGVMGPWNNAGVNHQKIAGLVFIAPEAGVYRVTGKASAKPWEGRAETFRLGVFKKDTQRALRVGVIDVSRNGEAQAIDLNVELTAGHELVLLPLMPDYNNATNITIRDVQITLTDE